MAGGIEAIAATIGVDLQRRLPGQNKKQREGLALLTATMLDVRSANLMDVAPHCRETPSASTCVTSGYRGCSAMS